MRLPQNRPHATHLKHEPLQDFKFLAIRFRQKFARLRSQIQQDGTRLEQGDGLAIRPLLKR